MFTKQFVLFTVACLIATVGQSQGLYVRASGAYQLGTRQGNVLAPFTNVLSLDSGFKPLIEVDENGVGYVQDSYGQGFQASLGVGYLFTENIGVDLALGYLFGSEQESKSEGGGYEYITRYSFNMLGISPSVVLRAPLGENFAICYRSGIIFGLVPELEITENHKIFSSSEINTNSEIQGSMSVGFQMAAGVEIGLSEKIVLTGELTYTAINFLPEEGEITKYEVDGVDQIQFLEESERKPKYSEYLSNSTDDLPAFPVSAASFSFGVGLKYSFGK